MGLRWRGKKSLLENTWQNRYNLQFKSFGLSKRYELFSLIKPKYVWGFWIYSFDSFLLNILQVRASVGCPDRICSDVQYWLLRLLKHWCLQITSVRCFVLTRRSAPCWLSCHPVYYLHAHIRAHSRGWKHAGWNRKDSKSLVVRSGTCLFAGCRHRNKMAVLYLVSNVSFWNVVIRVDTNGPTTCFLTRKTLSESLCMCRHVASQCSM